jgi:hypothetical protein
MRIRFAVVVFCVTTTMGAGVSSAQTYPSQAPSAPPPAAAPAPAYTPAAPASNAAVGSVRRQDRRQYVHEQKQRNEAEEALQNRARTTPNTRNRQR